MDNRTKEIMLTHWKGRFGNRMFTYLFGVNYARRYNLDFIMPSKWEGTVLFQDAGARVLHDEKLREQLILSGRERTSLDTRKSHVEEYAQRTGRTYTYFDPDSMDDIENSNLFFEKLCVQNSRIFTNYSLGEIREIFTWSDQVIRSDTFKAHEQRQGTYSVAHLRRDDISNIELNRKRNCGYSVLSKSSYEKAFRQYDVDPDDIVWITDDRSGNWGLKTTAGTRGGWRYPEGSKPVKDVFFDWFEDFLTLYFAGNIFRANSSFSWWGACLNPHARIFSPVLTERKLYLKPGDEIDVEFVEGNWPHWLNVVGRNPVDRIDIPA